MNENVSTIKGLVADVKEAVKECKSAWAAGDVLSKEALALLFQIARPTRSTLTGVRIVANGVGTIATGLRLQIEVLRRAIPQALAVVTGSMDGADMIPLSDIEEGMKDDAPPAPEPPAPRAKRVTTGVRKTKPN